jgi:suppressor of ftsI
MHRRKAKRGNPFADPVIVGRFVYHSHAADHEDKGMMAVIELLC